MTAPTLATAAVAGALLLGAPPKPRVDDVVQRASQWVQQFEHDFVTVIADEAYDQSVVRGSLPGPAHRQIQSELLFVQNGAPESWLAVRNVLAYTDDDRPTIVVPNSRDRLTLALAAGGPGTRTALRRLADEGARFNIGPIARNFNSPTLALQFLDEGHRRRFRFQMDGAERIGADETWRVRYGEHQHPTLVQANYRDTELEGRLWIRAADGAVLRTMMQLTGKPNNGLTGLTTTVTVDYAPDARLGMIAPARMEEEYRDPSGEQVIRGTATYSHYRVFETSARVITPNE